MEQSAVLAWIKSAKAFLKIQPGTGDNLLAEDIREGFVDYFLWSTFRPGCLDIDGELNMESLDSGMAMFKESPDTKDALRACYTQAFGGKWEEGNVVVLLEE